MTASDTSSARESRIHGWLVRCGLAAMLFGAAVAHGAETVCAGDCPAARAGAGRGPCRFGGAARDGIRRAAAELGADAEPSAACRNQYCAAVGAAGAGCVLVRPQAASLALGARPAGALGHRHIGHGQRRQHRQALDAARRAVRRRLSRADDAVADISGLHRVGVEHRRRGRSDAGRPRFVRSHAADRRALAAQGARSPRSTCSATVWAAPMRPSSKSIDAAQGKLKIHRAVMIDPPVSLFASIGRLDKLFAIDVGAGDDAIERLYRRLYAELANLYRASDRVQIDEEFILGAAAAILKTDAEFSAAIALELPHRSGECVFRRRPVRRHRRRRRSETSAEGRRFARGDPAACCATKPFAEYFTKVFAPYYLKQRPDSTAASLIADNRLDIIGDTPAQ